MNVNYSKFHLENIFLKEKKTTIGEKNDKKIF
jgi:hypothetical protein